MKWVVFVLILIGSAFWLFKANNQPTGMVLEPNSTALVALGKQQYTAHCASCHGAELDGQPNWRQVLPSGRAAAPPHDQTGHTWHHADSVLFKITKYGSAALAGKGYQSDMLGFQDKLSDQEIKAVLSYIKSRWPAEIQSRHDQINARSR